MGADLKLEGEMQRHHGIAIASGLLGLCLTAHIAEGQILDPGALGPAASTTAPNPLADTTMRPGKALLLDLEARFAKATAEGGGKAFAAWFAEDGVTLGNGQA